ncbi:MAG: ADP-glyceromanno-heptose 6-epimerase, partial [Bacteroidota bacterium]|nr:ADP-glyceromanno-heptose 6-epimerase [Bacteroidota bacterium]
PKAKIIFHLGARTDTTLQDKKTFNELNLEYSKGLWAYASKNKIPFIYASSAATYGDGTLGFDDEQPIDRYQPLNLYGQSKHDFDRWVLSQKEQPIFWAGFKFFNVYGPNEYHKERMASVVFHAFHQIIQSKMVKLFKSHREGFSDGEQKRDFIYVKDLCQTLFTCADKSGESAIYNLGTGQARTFKDLALAVFSALQINPQIEYIDTPKDIRNRYQYFTQATTSKLLGQGWIEKFQDLENGIEDYVKNYLKPKNYL